MSGLRVFPLLILPLLSTSLPCTHTQSRLLKRPYSNENLLFSFSFMSALLCPGCSVLTSRCGVIFSETRGEPESASYLTRVLISCTASDWQWAKSNRWSVYMLVCFSVCVCRLHESAFDKSCTHTHTDRKQIVCVVKGHVWQPLVFPSFTLSYIFSISTAETLRPERKATTLLTVKYIPQIFTPPL